MERGSILGYDLNEKYCQISYYSETREEPETLKITPDNGRAVGLRYGGRVLKGGGRKSFCGKSV